MRLLLQAYIIQFVNPKNASSPLAVSKRFSELAEFHEVSAASRQVHSVSGVAGMRTSRAVFCLPYNNIAIATCLEIELFNC